MGGFLQILGGGILGGPPNFWGVPPNFRGGVFFLGGGSSKFSGGQVPPNFRGRGIFWGGGGWVFQIFGGVLHQNTVNVRPVRILLECILVKDVFFQMVMLNTSVSAGCPERFRTLPEVVNVHL